MTTSPESGPHRRPHPRPLRALVAFDEESGARLLTTLLRQEGMHTTTARSAQELLSLLQVAQPAPERRYDLVICGLSAPNRRDVDLLAQVLDLGAPAPVVFLPRRGDLKARSTAERLGARWVVPRLRMLDDLQEIARYLHSARLWRDHETGAHRPSPAETADVGHQRIAGSSLRSSSSRSL